MREKSESQCKKNFKVFKGNGTMYIKLNNRTNGENGKTCQVKLTADWKSDLQYFDYDTDVPPLTMARAIAKEPWSREYFQMLKE